MAYTALEDMRRENERRFGRDLGPMQPAPFREEGRENGLQAASLRFLHERCEGLLFDESIAREEAETGVLQGKSLKAGQIPYNMQMDLDRLCLARSLESFFRSGVADDAYTVYYCYLVMFFGRYGRSKEIVELLSEYESNGSSLLMKHRDHYSHSVYVFALGLAIYETNAAFREAFRAFYGLDEGSAAGFFLEYWGLTSLFHDIGYPFELPFEQALSYFELDGQKRGRGCPYLAYCGVEALTALNGRTQDRLAALFGRRFADFCELMAFDLAQKLGAAYGVKEEQLHGLIEAKPAHPERFGYFMDHAFFSAARLCRELQETFGAQELERAHVDALSAILLHNSLYKFSIAFYKDPVRRKVPLRMEQHPLAWLLMLCDELQCWDRTAYGRRSRTELHPLAADFDFSGGAVSAVYYYDLGEREKIDAFRRRYQAWEAAGEQGEAPRLKAYSDMAEKEQRFTADIEKIVDTAQCPLHIRPDLREQDRRSKHTYLSSSSFLHLYDFAVALCARNASPDITTEQMEAGFDELSLEYQLSSINRAKSFSRYLNEIGCFYTDRPVDFELVTEFSPEQLSVIAPLEHERWVREHAAMGWRCGNEYETLPVAEGERAALREQLRRHRLAMDGEPGEAEVLAHYRSLPASEQGKDWRPFNSILRLLKKFDALRIYKL